MMVGAAWPCWRPCWDPRPPRPGRRRFSKQQLIEQQVIGSSSKPSHRFLARLDSMQIGWEPRRARFRGTSRPSTRSISRTISRPTQPYPGSINLWAPSRTRSNTQTRNSSPYQSVQPRPSFQALRGRARRRPRAGRSPRRRGATHRSSDRGWDRGTDPTTPRHRLRWTLRPSVPTTSPRTIRTDRRRGVQSSAARRPFGDAGPVANSIGSRTGKQEG